MSGHCYAMLGGSFGVIISITEPQRQRRQSCMPLAAN
jgi:hypothetical protein